MTSVYYPTVRRAITLVVSALLLLVAVSVLRGQAPERILTELTTTATEYGLTLTPNGKTAFFVMTDSFYVAKPRNIYRSDRVKGRWTPPVLASFSGTGSDSSPFVSPDGRQLFFTSRRPVNGEAATGANIWVVRLQSQQVIGEPAYLAAVNSDKSEYSPSVDRNGNLYFGSYREGGEGSGDLWYAPYVDGRYQTPVNLGPRLNTPEGEWGSCISPNGRYLLFENSGKEGNFSPAGDLYLSTLKDGTWTTPYHFAAPINSMGSDLTPKIHGKYLYFASNRPHGNDGMELNDVELYRVKWKRLRDQYRNF